jgi:hypothetical protein
MREKLAKGLPRPRIRQVRRTRDAARRAAERARSRAEDDDATAAEK